MSREIGAKSKIEAEASFAEPVLLVHFEFDDPVYVHSAVGAIEFDGNTYVGIGTLGSISSAEETETISPNEITFSLSGVDQNAIYESLRAATFGDRVTVYYGYRSSDGTLVEPPSIRWRGRIDSSSFKMGPDSAVSFTAHHRVSVISEIDGSRFTNEDQQTAYTDDEFFQHVADVPTKRLLWGGGPSATGARSDRQRFVRGRRDGRTNIP